jgi:hypothetical protein
MTFLFSVRGIFHVLIASQNNRLRVWFIKTANGVPTRALIPDPATIQCPSTTNNGVNTSLHDKYVQNRTPLVFDTSCCVGGTSAPKIEVSAPK